MFWNITLTFLCNGLQRSRLPLFSSMACWPDNDCQRMKSLCWNRLQPGSPFFQLDKPHCLCRCLREAVWIQIRMNRKTHWMLSCWEVQRRSRQVEFVEAASSAALPRVERHLDRWGRWRSGVVEELVVSSGEKLARRSPFLFSQPSSSSACAVQKKSGCLGGRLWKTEERKWAKGQSWRWGLFSSRSGWSGLRSFVPGWGLVWQLEVTAATLISVRIGCECGLTVIQTVESFGQKKAL